MTRIDIEELRSLILAGLANRFAADDASRIADIVIFGEMTGRTSHGILRVLPGSYGVMDEEPGPAPKVDRLGPSSARVEGRPGMLVAALGAELAGALAAESGFAVVTTRGSRSTSGSLTYFVERLANAGLVAFVSAGTVNFVTTPGGRERVLGTNPFAFGIPTLGRPFILDMATSAIAGGEVLTAAAEGSSLPAGVAVDSDGNPTTTPSDVLKGGALLPFGGHKGLGLSMMIEILNTALTGAEGDPVDWGHMFVAFSVSLLGDEIEIRRRAENDLERMRAAGARIPGHNSLANRDEALERGWVDVDDEALSRLVEQAGTRS